MVAQDNEKKIFDEKKRRIAVFHFNHLLRDTSDRDERFVEKLCAGLDVPFYHESGNVAGWARENRCSTEEAARILRYEALMRCRERIGADRVATAHHRSDQAETILFSLCRGSGLQGLAGIRPVRDCVIRPLLCLEKEEIDRYIRTDIHVSK